MTVNWKKRVETPLVSYRRKLWTLASEYLDGLDQKDLFAYKTACHPSQRYDLYAVSTKAAEAAGEVILVVLVAHMQCTLCHTVTRIGLKIIPHVSLLDPPKS